MLSKSTNYDFLHQCKTLLLWIDHPCNYSTSKIVFFSAHARVHIYSELLLNGVLNRILYVLLLQYVCLDNIAEHITEHAVIYLVLHLCKSTPLN